MIIRDEILKEHSRTNALKIASYACSSKKNFKELMQCFLDKEYRVAQRAAWSVSWASRQKPEMIEPYIKTLVEQLKRKDVHQAVIRNTVRIFEELELPKAFHGEVMNACFYFIEEPSTPVAIKSFSLTILFNLSKQYPEIKNELRLIIEERWDTETAAFKARGKKILKSFKTNNQHETFFGKHKFISN